MTNEEALADFRRRYEHTYVWLRMEDKDVETLVHVDRVANDENKIGVLHLTSEKFGSLTINLGSSEHCLQFRYPPVGVFQHGADALVFFRRPARQYRRGICSDNSSLFNVTRQVTGRGTDWSAGEIQSAYDHKVMTLPEGIKALKHPAMRSVALPRNFAITKSMIKSVSDHILFHWMNPVAYLDPETGAVKSMIEEKMGTLVKGLYK